MSDVKNTFMSRGQFFQTIVLSTTNLCYLQNWTLGPKTQFSVVRCENFLHKQGLLLWDNHLSTNNPMLSSKLNVLSHNSIPSCQIWKIPSQAGVVGLQKLFWVSTILCYLQNWTFLFISIVFALSLHKPHFFTFQMLFW